MALRQPDKIKSNNPKEFGIVDAVEISGHKSALGDELLSIPDNILSASGDNTDNDAIGNIWFVRGKNRYFQLKKWDLRHSWKGWRELNLQGAGQNDADSFNESFNRVPIYRITGRHGHAEGVSYTQNPNRQKKVTVSKKEARKIFTDSEFHVGDTFFVFVDSIDDFCGYRVRDFDKDDPLHHNPILSDVYKGPIGEPIQFDMDDDGMWVYGNQSHAEGECTETENTAEHAQGRFNKSNLNTIDSVGIGERFKRKNATETMNSGRHYIIGIGGYDGTNPDTAQSVQQVLKKIQGEVGPEISIGDVEPVDPNVVLWIDTSI